HGRPFVRSGVYVLDFGRQGRRLVLRRALRLNPGVHLDGAAVPSLDRDPAVLPWVDRNGPSGHEGHDADFTAPGAPLVTMLAALRHPACVRRALGAGR